VDKDARPYLYKAQESLEGATSEYSNKRYNNCANRAYYACFQVAIYALLMTNMKQPTNGKWRHEYVKAQFVSQFINKKKVYSGDLRDILERYYERRQRADYDDGQVSNKEAYRSLSRAKEFVVAVEGRIKQ
jgi:uncharacterized protein (UPF0332 family)